MAWVSSPFPAIYSFSSSPFATLAAISSFAAEDAKGIKKRHLLGSVLLCTCSSAHPPKIQKPFASLQLLLQLEAVPLHVLSNLRGFVALSFAHQSSSSVLWGAGGPSSAPGQEGHNLLYNMNSAQYHKAEFSWTQVLDDKSGFNQTSKVAVFGPFQLDSSLLRHAAKE